MAERRPAAPGRSCSWSSCSSSRRPSCSAPAARTTSPESGGPRAGFTNASKPLIVDTNLPRTLAGDLRAAGYNARSVPEIFGKDPGDPAIKALADQLDSKVLTVDRGHQITGGFFERTIQVSDRVRATGSILRILQQAGEQAAKGGGQTP
jgi:hypothetical protein